MTTRRRRCTRRPRHWPTGRRNRSPVAPRRFSRRGFLRGAGISAARGIGLPGLLAACGTEGTQQTAETCVSTDISDTEKKLIFSNWPRVHRRGQAACPTLEDFQTESGISVTYNTDINGNNEFFAKIRNQLGACEPTERDIIVLTDWMAARVVIGSAGLQELDHGNMPERPGEPGRILQEPAWDPDRDTPSRGRAG